MESYRTMEKRVEGNRMTTKEITKCNGMEWSRTEWNGMEWSGVVNKKAEKVEEHARRCYRPTRGWAMRASQKITYGNLG